MDDEDHSDEAHARQSEEIYQAICKIIDDKCRTPTLQALSRCVFDVVTSGYPEDINKDEIIYMLAEHNNLIIQNMKRIFEKEEAMNEGANRSKH